MTTKTRRTRTSIEKLMAQADQEFKEAVLNQYDISEEDIDHYLNQPILMEDATAIAPLDLNKHEPFLDICYLECVVMNNKEVISGELGSLGFIGRKIELKSVYTSRL